MAYASFVLFGFMGYGGFFSYLWVLFVQGAPAILLQMAVVLPLCDRLHKQLVPVWERKPPAHMVPLQTQLR